MRFIPPALQLLRPGIVGALRNSTRPPSRGISNKHYRTMSASIERAAEVSESLAEIKARVEASSLPSAPFPPTLVAVSKYKPASDILTCYEDGQLDFGENYVQELVEKAAALPLEIRWHFIGTLQSNKAKTLAAIPNLDTIQTLTSFKTAKALDKAIPDDRKMPLKILLQVNTSGEDSKSGLPPINTADGIAESELAKLAVSIISDCPKLLLQGLMAIGALDQSLSASETEKNADFDTLKATRDFLQKYLASHVDEGGWGRDKRLVLSMGMSSDFEAALKAGSDIVRVGTGIFGQRPKKTSE
ncbi:hypothetical protein BDZ94DRAFT_1257878 [Collybia nuda]|uniref:Pyridoxal phosphate homeostasis protein n=1 Tax=Collybia nuda TaxID=64659 RepID=A0A9P6CKK7_9AGAR|nr:hypothetical protein BDZ94DRAFT_1257878 [Collybia nuda]